MVEHVSIVDTERHEAKGASTALTDQVLHANGDGTTTFRQVSYTNLSDVPVPVGYQMVLYGASNAAVQQPSAVNTPIDIEFGPAQSLTDVSVSSGGLVTFNTAGQYSITVFLRFGRTTGAGSAILFNRFLINGTQGLSSNSISVSDDASTIPFSATIFFDADAGDTYQQQIYRDSAGVNNGGVFQTSPNLAGWSVSPSASISVSKFIGDAP